MKIHPNAPNPMFGINNNNTLHNKKTAVNDTISDIANMQERKDMYVPKDSFKDATSENATYDQNGQLLNNSNQKKVSNEVNEEIDYSKINGTVTPTYRTIINGVETDIRKSTEEETQLFNLKMKLYSLSARQLLSEKTRLEDELDLHGTHLSIDQLYAKYDEKFGTNSADKINKLNILWNQYNKVGNMMTALEKAITAGKTRNEAMDFANDSSFNKDEFDYVMNIVDNYDYQNHKITDKNVVKNDNSNISTDLKNSMSDLLELFGQA